MSASSAAHWERLHRDSRPEEVSWFEPVPHTSLALIEASGVARTDPILDAGGGVSTLVDHLLDRGYEALTVLDVSEAALAHAASRLGQRARKVRFIEGDVLSAPLEGPYALWHDRAVFHFLVRDDDRRAYAARMGATVRSGGHAIVATFADDGPERCSGLPVVRHDEEQLAERFAETFDMVESRRTTHRTPKGVEQRFVYVRLRRR